MCTYTIHFLKCVQNKINIVLHDIVGAYSVVLQSRCQIFKVLEVFHTYKLSMKNEISVSLSKIIY